ncbi:hypothetical protein JHJ32_12570 [Parapedobacter sp. ISTM3]|uniref:hypothetical protein n=1 Tax=Parapedobacter sp. ISTM3 TaxID=2800130 RepID=UPI001903B67B|nr:hypothetical protein [Parapedobacter sp. ISTM3]MBK1440825.1 hypothetical protein [Parapedobacter sp. ISTM3]
MIPDSLCTVEQQEVHEKAKKKIPRIYVEQVVVEDSLLELIKPKFAVKDTINPLFDEKPYIWY